MNQKRKAVFKLCITAILTALCFSATYISIPLPTGAKVHLGNFVCIIAGLLCGGVIGGITGSLGMGLNDICTGYAWSTTTRTFIVKFLLGFIVGVLFRILVRKEKLSKMLLRVLTAVFLLAFISCLSFYIIGSGHFVVNIGDVVKEVKISVLVPIFLGIITLLLFVGSILLSFLSNVQCAVASAATLGITFNVLGEFLLKWLLYGIDQSDFNVSLAAAIGSLPAGLITGTLTIVLSTFIFLPIYYALKSTSYPRYFNLELPDNKLE